MAHTFNNITELKARRGIEDATVHVLGYYAQGDGGGGEFRYDTSSTADDDGGTVFLPSVGSGAGRWVRIYQANILNIKWFGAKGDNNEFDNLAVFTAAIAVLTPGGTLLIPEGTYQISDTITLTKRIDLYGTGGGTYLRINTILEWPNVPGIQFKQINADNSKISNIFFKSTYGSDNTAIGLDIDCRMICTNLAFQGWQSHGLSIDSIASGNADSGLYNTIVSVENLGHGVYVVGQDSNNIQFTNIFASANGRSNIYDNSFLGNTWINCHTSFAGMLAGSSAWVTHNDTFYCAIYPPSHTNIEPGVTSGWEDYWQQFDGVENGSIPQPWNSSHTYYCSVAYALVGANNYGLMLGCYSESGQAGSLLVGYSQAIGGDHGASFNTKSAAFLSISEGEFYSYAGIRVVNQDDLLNYTLMSSKYGFMIGNSIGAMQIKAFDDHVIRFYSQNSIDQTGLYFSLVGYDKTKAGLTTDFPANVPILTHQGMWLTNRGLDKIRNFIGATAVPSVGEHAQGDWAQNIGTDNTILGWKCTVSGTPGTWITCYVNTTAP